MALEHIKENDVIDENKVRYSPIGTFFSVSHSNINWQQFEDLDSWITVDPKRNIVAFKIQNGPIKEVGENGCQLDAMVAFTKHLLERLNKNFPCNENAAAIEHLGESMTWLKERKKDREARGVEGVSKI